MAIEVKATAFSYVTHVLGIAAAVLVLVWTIHFRGGLAWEDSNKSLIFNLHPVLILIGLIIIGGEAIISYKSLPLKKQEKKLIHLVLHGIALILGIIGVYLAFKFHNESNIANLYSLHSWLGIGIISLYGIQAYKWGLFMLPGFHYLFSAWLLIVVGVLLATRLTSDSPQEYLWIYGFVVFFYPGGTALIRKESLPWHVLFGLFVYVLAVGNATLGFLEKLTFLENSGLAKYGSEAFLVNFTAIVTVLFGTFVLLTVLSQAPAEDNFRYEAI